jgi:peroxiredoxin
MKTIKILILLTFLLSYVNTLLGQQQQDTSSIRHVTYVTGKIKDKIKDDTILLILHGQFFSFSRGYEWRASKILKTIADTDGLFKFKIITGNSPFHLSLFLSCKRNSQGFLNGNPAIDDYLIAPGDSIHIVFDDNVHHYYGKGSDLFEAQYMVRQTDIDGNILKSSDDSGFRAGSRKWLMQKDSLLNAQLDVLKNYKSKLSPLSYGIVRADIVGANRAAVFGSIIPRVHLLQSVNDKSVDSDLADALKELKNGFADIDPTDKSSLSPKYIFYLYLKLGLELKYDRLISGNNTRDYNYFSTISQHYSGTLRDKLLAWWLLDVSSINNLQPEYIAKALAVMKTPFYIEIVHGLEETYGKGQQLTDFDFKDAQGKTVHLADFKGKVVLVDLWFSGCAGCVRVAAGLRLVEEAFKNRHDINFISISIDKDKQLWLRSIEKNVSVKAYTYFTTATTTYLFTAGTGINNAFIKKYVPEGSYPSLLIIDKEGKLFSATPSRPVTKETQSALIKELNDALANK